MNNVATKAVIRDNKFAEPLADIMPPRAPPPSPKPSLSVPCSKTKITKKC